MNNFKKRTDERLNALSFNTSIEAIVNPVKEKKIAPLRILSRASIIAASIVVIISVSISAYAVNFYNEASQNLAREYFFSNVNESVVIDETTQGADKEDFYLRYISEEDMAIIDKAAEHQGAQLYFEGLESDNIYTQYFCINKLIGFFNEPTTREKAVAAIKPFINSPYKQISSSAKFALSIMNQTFDHEWIYKLYDGSVVFTAFTDYSAYGSYPVIFTIKDGRLEKYFELSSPMKYIKKMECSPDKKSILITACSNKSDFMFVLNTETHITSSELVASIRNIVANSEGYINPTRIDFENYSTIENFKWTDNETLIFSLSMPFNNMEVVESVTGVYNIISRSLTYETETN